MLKKIHPTFGKVCQSDLSQVDIVSTAAVTAKYKKTPTFE